MPAAEGPSTRQKYNSGHAMPDEAEEAQEVEGPSEKGESRVTVVDK